MTGEELVTARVARLFADVGVVISEEWRGTGSLVSSPVTKAIGMTHPRPHELTRVIVGVDWWAKSFHVQTVGIHVHDDAMLEVRARVRFIDRQLVPIVRDQGELAAAARARGYDRPLERHRLDNLVIDRDSLATLVDLTDGERSARDWLAQRFATYLRHESSTDGLHVDGFRLLPMLPIAAGPVVTLPSADTSLGSFAAEISGNLWIGDNLRLRVRLPDLALASMEGRLVDDVLAGLPIGHRRIINATEILAELVRLRLERDDVPIPGA